MPTFRLSRGGRSSLPTVTSVNGVWMRLSETMVSFPEALGMALPKGMTTS